MSARSVLLVNLGTPRSPAVADVQAYLEEFLMDSRVIDYPAFLRWLLVKRLIIPRRKHRSAEAYASIWTESGSPLMVISRELCAALQSALGPELPVALAMRYGEPSIAGAVESLRDRGVREVLLVPLYPHYAMSSYETVVARYDEAVAALAPSLRTTVLQPFFQDPGYIAALVSSARPWLERPWDHLLLSFHGVPRRHLLKADASRSWCLSRPDCCSTCHPAQAMCYRAQTQATAREFARLAGLPADRVSVSYQSRLGREEWLRPYTDETLRALGQRKVGRLLCLTPAFVSDCLETLEEIRVEGSEIFRHAGGREFEHIPCLNTHPDWVAYLARQARAWVAGASLLPAGATPYAGSAAASAPPSA